MGTKLTPQARLANLAKQAISTLKSSGKKTVRQNNRTITIIEVKKQSIPSQEQQAQKSLMEYRCQTIPDTYISATYTSKHEAHSTTKNRVTTPPHNEDDFKKLNHNQEKVKQQIKALKKRNEKDWNSMKKILKKKRRLHKTA